MIPIKVCTMITNLWLFVHALYYLNAERQGRKQHVPFLGFGMTWQGVRTTNAPKFRADSLTITPPTLVINGVGNFHAFCFCAS